MSLKYRVCLAWLWAALCILAIFLVVPTARAIQTFISEHWGRPLFGYLVLIVTGVVFLAILSILYFRFRIRSLSNYIWLLSAAGLTTSITLKLWQNPEEAVHFLEYGLLGYFLFRALRFSIKDKSIYFTAFFIGSLAGIFDEILQWMMPGRYWDIRDVGLNALAVALFQMALWKGLMIKMSFERLKPKSIKIASLLFSTNLILLGLCLSNTPSRVSACTERMPFLSFLQKEEPMREFKFKHMDPDIGAFYSRLTMDGLKKTDKESHLSYARILQEWKDNDYGRFLQAFPAVSHPFLYEMRVHLFRRDRKYEQGQKTTDQKARKEAFFAAYKENLILENYFGQTLQRSGYQWSQDKILSIESRIDRNASYTSPVSRDIFIWLSEKAMWAAVLTVSVFLAAFNLWFSRRKRP